MRRMRVPAFAGRLLKAAGLGLASLELRFAGRLWLPPFAVVPLGLAVLALAVRPALARVPAALWLAGWVSLLPLVPFAQGAPRSRATARLGGGCMLRVSLLARAAGRAKGGPRAPKTAS